jgi:thioesterase domain-containing protein
VVAVEFPVVGSYSADPGELRRQVQELERRIQELVAQLNREQETQNDRLTALETP